MIKPVNAYRNGFSFPLNPTQIASWVIIFFNFIVYFLIQIPTSLNIIVH